MGIQYTTGRCMYVLYMSMSRVSYRVAEIAVPRAHAAPHGRIRIRIRVLVVGDHLVFMRESIDR